MLYLQDHIEGVTEIPVKTHLVEGNEEGGCNGNGPSQQHSLPPLPPQVKEALRGRERRTSL